MFIAESMLHRLQAMHSLFFGQEFWSWTVRNINNSVAVNGKQWDTIFAVTRDNIWRSRNKMIFENHHLHPTVVVAQIVSQVLAIGDSHQYFKSVLPRSQNVREKTSVEWVKPSGRSIQIEL